MLIRYMCNEDRSSAIKTLVEVVQFSYDLESETLWVGCAESGEIINFLVPKYKYQMLEEEMYAKGKVDLTEYKVIDEE